MVFVVLGANLSPSELLKKSSQNSVSLAVTLGKDQQWKQREQATNKLPIIRKTRLLIVLIFALAYCSEMLFLLACCLIVGLVNADALGDARGAQTRADDLSNELMQKMMALESETNSKKVPIFAERDSQLASVDGFWARTIENHPSHGNWIFGQDRELLKYISGISIEEIEPDHHHFKIVMSLKGNPFIANEKLWRTVTGQENEETGPVDWVGEAKPTGLSFFSFFDANAQNKLDPQTISDITHVLRYELHQNPFTFYDLPTIDEIASQHFEGGDTEGLEDLTEDMGEERVLAENDAPDE